MKKLTALVLFILFLVPGHIFAKTESTTAKKAPVSTPAAKNTVAAVAPITKNAASPVEDQFKKSFPKNNFESITPTEIKGIYEIYTGNQIYYYMPKDDVVLYGNIVNKSGISITRESLFKKMAQKMAKIPLDSALKTGNGKTSVVEFMDPNCYHCRQAYKFFSQRKDVTVYTFLIPILSKDSGDKIKHILCSKDVLKTYDDVMNGNLDNKAPLTACTDKKVDETVKTYMQIASQIGVKATPLFYIKGQMVEGFDPPAIEKLLKEQ